MWQICPELPILPGYTLNRNLGRTKFNKISHFDFVNGVALVHEVPPQYKRHQNIDYANHSVVPKNVLLYGVNNILYKVRPVRVKLPSKPKTIITADKCTDSIQTPETKPEDSYIIYSKRVLCFDGVLLEEERFTCDARKVKIRFFLQDSTVEVVEPKVMKDEGVQVLEEEAELCEYTNADESVTSLEVENILVYRQKVQFVAPMDGDFSNIKAFNIGKEVVFQDKLFKIIDCDESTKKFLNRCGIIVPKPIVV